MSKADVLEIKFILNCFGPKKTERLVLASIEHIYSIIV